MQPAHSALPAAMAAHNVSPVEPPFTSSSALNLQTPYINPLLHPSNLFRPPTTSSFNLLPLPPPAPAPLPPLCTQNDFTTSRLQLQTTKTLQVSIPALLTSNSPPPHPLTSSSLLPPLSRFILTHCTDSSSPRAHDHVLYHPSQPGWPASTSNLLHRRIRLCLCSSNLFRRRIRLRLCACSSACSSSCCPGRCPPCSPPSASVGRPSQ